MARLSAKLRSVEWKGSKGIAFWCPGCDRPHVINIEGDGAWQWDGNVDRPTIAPSIRTFTNYDDKNGRLPEGQERTLCHSFVREGVIDFLYDSAEHELRGPHPLPDWPDRAGEA